jgi:hypothetical protein
MARSGKPTVVFRATRREPDGNEHTSEREVTCASRAELLELLCQPWDDMPRPADTTAERWNESVAQLESWLSALRFELVQERTGDRSSRWTFALRPTAADADSPAAPISASQGHEERDGAAVQFGGGIHATLQPAPVDGTMHVHNHGMLVWNHGNIYMQVHLLANLTVNVPPT